MANIVDLDKNFKVETNIERDGLTFFDAKKPPFKVYGVYHDGTLYRRMPDDVAEQTNVGVHNLAKNTAGGRVRFITNSPYVVIKVHTPYSVKFSHMPLTAMMGLDMYSFEDGKYTILKTFVPPTKFKDCYDSVFDFQGGEKLRDLTINFPLYNDVLELYIGVKEGSIIREAPEYKISKPIVYYGSSITQGGCASRPGTSYPAIISRKYDADYINLGFSGNGKGEAVMADYIAGLDMSVFVYDFDHNAPTLEHYAERHEPFYKTVRAAHPDIPIVMMTRPKPKHFLCDAELQRIEVARRTYENARARGENVYFIPGYELMDIAGEDGCVDLCHPTDLGFFSMAERLSRELDKILL